MNSEKCWDQLNNQDRGKLVNRVRHLDKASKVGLSLKKRNLWQPLYIHKKLFFKSNLIFFQPILPENQQKLANKRKYKVVLFFFHGCEVALTSHICCPIRLVFHQHLNSHVAYPGIPPEPSNHTRGQFLHLPSYPLLRLL